LVGVPAHPFPLDRCRRQIENPCGFFDSQTSKEAKFYDLSLPRIQLRQIIEGIMTWRKGW